jgi:hypothetical protein
MNGMGYGSMSNSIPLIGELLLPPGLWKSPNSLVTENPALVSVTP